VTIREDVRNHFERDATRHPVPPGLRTTALAGARSSVIERRSPHWIASAVAIVLAVAIIAGLLAVGALRHAQPVPVHGPKLLFHDNLTAVVAGRPFLDDPQQSQVHFPSMELAASCCYSATPGRAAAYQTDPALAPSPADVGRVWGITSQPLLQRSWTQIGDVQYFVESGVIAYNRPNTPQAVRAAGPGNLPHAITNQTSAIAMTRDYLVARGLFSREEVQSMPGSAHRNLFPTPNAPFWSVVIQRTLGGLRDYGFGSAGATLHVADNGRIDSIIIVRRSIAGQEPAQLISAAEAFRQVTLGHWYVAENPLNQVDRDQPPFAADKVELSYWEGGDLTKSETWLVPMWRFSQSSDPMVALYYPALAPGTFDWTVPNH
jgi:hypothetical protein